MTELEQYSKTYVNSLEFNDSIYKDFTEITNSIPILSVHRDFIEKNQLGFGERAFHYLWLIILKHLTEKFGSLSGLEIGVYKGQIISLWALLAKNFSWQINLSAISPLEGNVKAKLKAVKLIKFVLDKNFRVNRKLGNNYEVCDYYTIIRDLFKYFELDFNSVSFHKGYSNDDAILKQMENQKFHFIYIDGDHSYEGVANDLKNYLPKIVRGGILVMDDASYFLPSSAFWKGHKEVSRAVEMIPDEHFTNILNVGHNRAFIKN